METTSDVKDKGNFPIFTPLQSKKRNKTMAGHTPSPLEKSRNEELQLIMDALQINRKENLDGHKQLRETFESSQKTVLEEFALLASSFGEKISKVEENVVRLSENVSKHEKSLEIIRRQMNDMEQLKFENHIEIIGVSISEILANPNEIPNLATSVITKFVSDFDRSTIKNAFTRNIRSSGAPVIIVEFKDTDSKLNVMKKKKEAPVDTIFFNDRLSTLTRALFQKTRQVVKDIGAKRAIVNHGKISIIMQDDSQFKIRWFDDLNKYAQPNP